MAIHKWFELRIRYTLMCLKYTTDKEYPVGTVMCVGGSHETTATTSGTFKKLPWGQRGFEISRL